MVIRLYLLNSVDGVGVFGRRTNGECKNKVGEELTHIREGEDEGNTSTPCEYCFNIHVSDVLNDLLTGFFSLVCHRSQGLERFY